MKYSTFIGIAACVLLIIACFLPWAYYPDLDKNFTGFFSENNNYGKPGKIFVFLSLVAIIFFAIPKIWAKRFNMLFTVLALSFAIKSYMLFTACYRGICPDKKVGVFLILIASVMMVLSAVLPDLKLKEESTVK